MGGGGVSAAPGHFPGGRGKTRAADFPRDYKGCLINGRAPNKSFLF